MQATYVLPMRWHDDAELADLVDYLQRMPEWVQPIVVDGSEPELFAQHAAAFPDRVRHVRPTSPPTLNGKVAGVDTGIRLADTEHIVMADDDVRYDEPALREVVSLLADADVVMPQNVFSRPLSWHARWDTGRTLLNRAFGADYGGTCAVRRSTYLAIDGYDGDTMFENLELLRTVEVHGGSTLRPRWIYVPRRAPDTRHFFRQRIRQAYDDFAQPWRLVLELSVLP